jgi:hypothetical protein
VTFRETDREDSAARQRCDRMGILGWLERRLWTGEVLKDYGAVGEHAYPGGSETVSVLLSKKRRGPRLILRISNRALFGFAVRYVELDPEAVRGLRVVIDDALPLMSSSDIGRR